MSVVNVDQESSSNKSSHNVAQPLREEAAESSEETSNGAQALARLLECLIQGSHIFEETSEGVKQLDSAPRSAVQRGERRIFMLFQPASAAKKERAEARMNINSNSTTAGASDRYDYERKYPEDEEGKGMDPNARVWRVYLDEAGHFDLDMVENIRDTVDVILVFAGLFSAVVATLVASIVTALQPDFGQVTAALLVELIAVQRAMVDGSFSDNVNQSPLTFQAPGPVTISSTDRWINGLWFVSLAISLSTALLAVLVKQWIQAYVSPTFGTPQNQARVRHFRYMGMQAWHVPVIAGLLPVLLHLSLFLFVAGLITLLYSLDHVIGGIVATIGALACSAYAITNLLPFHYPQCPYKTPLSSYAFIIMHACKPVLSRAWARVLPMMQAIFGPVWTPVRKEFLQVMSAISIRRDILAWEKEESIKKQKELQYSLESERKDGQGYFTWLESEEEANSEQIRASNEHPDTLTQSEASAVQFAGDRIDAQMFGWLCAMSSNPSVRTMVAYAVNDLRMDFPTDVLYQLRDSILPHVCAALHDCQADGDVLDPASRRLRTGVGKKAFRLLVALIQLRAHSHHLKIARLWDSIHQSPLRHVCRCTWVDRLDGKLDSPHLEEPRLVAFRYIRSTGVRGQKRADGGSSGGGSVSPIDWHPLDIALDIPSRWAEMATLMSSSSTSSVLRIAILQDALLALINNFNRDRGTRRTFDIGDLPMVAELFERHQSIFETARGTTVQRWAHLREAALLSAYLNHFTSLDKMTVQDHRHLGVGLGVDRYTQTAQPLMRYGFPIALDVKLSKYYNTRTGFQLIAHLVRASVGSDGSIALRDVAHRLLPLRKSVYSSWDSWDSDYTLSDDHPLLQSRYYQQLIPTPGIIQAIIDEFDVANPTAIVDLLDMILLLVGRLLQGWQQCPGVLSVVKDNQFLQALDSMNQFLDVNVPLYPSGSDSMFPIKPRPLRFELLITIYRWTLKLSTTIQPPLSPADLRDYQDHVLAYLPHFCSWALSHKHPDPDCLHEVIAFAYREIPLETLDKAWGNAIDTLHLSLVAEEDRASLDNFIGQLRRTMLNRTREASQSKKQVISTSSNRPDYPSDMIKPTSNSTSPSTSALTKFKHLLHRRHTFGDKSGPSSALEVAQTRNLHAVNLGTGVDAVDNFVTVAGDEENRRAGEIV